MRTPLTFFEIAPASWNDRPRPSVLLVCFNGVAARVLSRGRTCYTVQAPGVRLRVRFEAVRSVEPA